MIAAVVLAAAAATPPVPPVTRAAFRGGERIEVDAGGTIRDVAILRGEDAGPVLYFLVEEPGDDPLPTRTCDVRPEGAPPVSALPRRLVRIDSLSDPVPRPVGEGVGPAVRSLQAVDLDGDGRDDLLLGRPGGLDLWRDGASTPLVSSPGLEPAPGFGRPRGPVAATRLHVFHVGSVATFGPGAEGNGWTRRGSAALPVDVRGGARALTLRTRPFVPVGSSAAGGDVLASDPESVGEERIRVWRVEPEGASGDAEECWARLPGPERLVGADYVVLDSAPALVITTTRADKLEIFGEKRLRVFRLASDRTRTGVPPFLSAETGANLWQGVQARTTDVDGDGRDDLVLAFWKGLKNEKVEFEIWSRDADGAWPSRPSGGSLSVPDADKSYLDYGEDVNGDGRPDLLLAGKGALRIHLGLPQPRRGLPVDREPVAVLPLPEGVDRLGTSWVGMGPRGLQAGTYRTGAFPPRAVDLDGDGVLEILLVDPNRPDRLFLYRWTPGGSR